MELSLFDSHKNRNKAFKNIDIKYESQNHTGTLVFQLDLTGQNEPK